MQRQCSLANSQRATSDTSDLQRDSTIGNILDLRFVWSEVAIRDRFYQRGAVMYPMRHQLKSHVLTAGVEPVGAGKRVTTAAQEKLTFRRKEPSESLPPRTRIRQSSRGTGRMRDTPPVGRKDAAFKAIERGDGAARGARTPLPHLFPRWAKVRQHATALLSAL